LNAWQPFCFCNSKSRPDIFITSLDRFGIKNGRNKMAANLEAILFLDHLKTGPNNSASLDHFGIKNILFVTLFFIKQSRLATIPNLDKKVWISNGPI
jgi:hypothetical protein